MGSAFLLWAGWQGSRAIGLVPIIGAAAAWPEAALLRGFGSTRRTTRVRLQPQRPQFASGSVRSRLAVRGQTYGFRRAIRLLKRTSLRQSRLRQGPSRWACVNNPVPVAHFPWHFTVFIGDSKGQRRGAFMGWVAIRGGLFYGIKASLQVGNPENFSGIKSGGG